MAIPALPAAVVTAFASPEHRLWHYLWHGVRNVWNQLEQADKDAILAVYPGWEPPNPALDAENRPIRENNSGEDFLYMHRTMIMMVNAILAGEGNVNYPWVRGWHRLPRPGDQNSPVPPMFSTGDPDDDATFQTLKGDAFFWSRMAGLEQQFTDPDYLRSVTMGQLGSDIEFTVHNWLHGRFAAESPVGYRPATVLTDPVAAQWNDPAYNWLADTYSSHVNPTFWKLHGWVDDRIDDWMRANGAEDYQWKSTWVGDPVPAMVHALHQPHAVHHRHPEPATTENLNKIAAVLGRAGWRGYFIDVMGTQPPARIMVPEPVLLR